MSTNKMNEPYGTISMAELDELEKYMQMQFKQVQIEYGIPMTKFFRQDALIISVDAYHEPFLPISKGYNRPKNRIELPSYCRGYPTLLSKIAKRVESGRLFLYANGVWVAEKSTPGPAYRRISWLLPRDSWLLRKNPFYRESAVAKAI